MAVVVVDGFLKKRNPFFEIYKLFDAGGDGMKKMWSIVYRSEAIMNDLNPKWKTVSISLNNLCDNNRGQKLSFHFKDWVKNGKHISLGKFEASMNDIINNNNNRNSQQQGEFKIMQKMKIHGRVIVVAAVIEGGDTVINNNNNMTTTDECIGNESKTSTINIDASNFQTTTEAWNKQPHLTNSIITIAVPVGEIHIDGSVPLEPPTLAHAYKIPSSSKLTNATPPLAISAPMKPTIISRPTFLDYLIGGLQLQLSVAIDFTGSNGDPRKAGTLHHIDRGEFNDYEKALTAVGAIIAKYDSDQMFPMLGFGAKYGGVVRHCFQLGQTPEVKGVKGMLDAYRDTFKSGLIMSGPTVFAEVIHLAATRARREQEAASRIGAQSYHILLILTDGSVSNVEVTRQAIQAASNSPLSIVIVGIGNADFSAMQFLDDFQNGEFGGEGRDICQFVEFSRHKYNKSSLTKASLEEIPDQVVEYFYTNNRIKPNPPISDNRVVPEEYSEEEQINVDFDFGDDGEIKLCGGGICNDTSYGNQNNFTGIGPMAPPLPQVTAVPTVYTPQIYHQPSNNNMAQYTNSQKQYSRHTTTAYSQHFATNPPVANSYGQSSQYLQQQQPVVTASPIFHFQVPQDVIAGQQIQIQHPHSGQQMIVTVPKGIAAGGTFPVAY